MDFVFEMHNSLLSRFIKLLMYVERDEMVGNLQQIILLPVRLNSPRSPQRSSGEKKNRSAADFFFDGTDLKLYGCELGRNLFCFIDYFKP